MNLANTVFARTGDGIKVEKSFLVIVLVRVLLASAFLVSSCGQRQVQLYFFPIISKGA